MTVYHVSFTQRGHRSRCFQNSPALPPIFAPGYKSTQGPPFAALCVSLHNNHTILLHKLWLRGSPWTIRRGGLLAQIESSGNLLLWGVLFCVAMAWYDKKPAVYGDLETGYGNTAALYPGIPADENELRWGFIRKVYGILSLQVVLTTLVAGMVVVTPAITEFFVRSPWSLIFIAFLPLICKSTPPHPISSLQNICHTWIIAD